MKSIAVIGCGRIADSAHLPALSSMKGIRIKYVCDIIESKALCAKKKYGADYAITDYKAAFKDEDVDAVWVLTPNYAHYFITMDALKAHKHVFCEKPIAVDYAKSMEMAAEAERQGKMLNIGVCNRHNKAVEELAKLYGDGKFGNIYHVHCSFRDFRSIPGLGGDFTNKNRSGGGVLIDWGVHFFDLVMYILGGAKLKSVSCNVYTEIAKDMKAYKYRNMWAEDTSDIVNGINDVDDYATGFIRLDKASMSFDGAWAQNVEKTEMYVDFLGDKGGARLEYGKKFTFWDGRTLESFTVGCGNCDHYREEDEAFLQSLDTGVPDRNHIDFVLESAKLLQALYDSANIKEEIKF